MHDMNDVIIHDVFCLYGNRNENPLNVTSSTYENGLWISLTEPPLKTVHINSYFSVYVFLYILYYNQKF